MGLPPSSMTMVLLQRRAPALSIECGAWAFICIYWLSLNTAGRFCNHAHIPHYLSFLALPHIEQQADNLLNKYLEALGLYTGSHFTS